MVHRESTRAGLFLTCRAAFEYQKSVVHTFAELSFDWLFNWESSENMFFSVAIVICIIYRSDSPYKAVENER